jgi:hypothetical protein
VSVLPDGSYDAIVIDADPAVPGPGTDIELTLVSGEHKGEVVGVTADGWEGDELDLLGLPATLIVEDGAPRVSIDR